MSVLTRIDGIAPLGTHLPLGLGAGANVRTPCGLRHVENLRPGDLIVTRRDGLQPLRMIWKRTISGAEVAADPSLAPVVIPPRAIGPMMPQQELRVAGSHGLLIPGYRVEGQDDSTSCLMRARDFAEISEDVRIDRSGTDMVYYNLVFDTHQVFTANGLPVESFLPTQHALSLLADDDREALEHVVPGLCSGEAEYAATAYPVWDIEAQIAVGA